MHRIKPNVSRCAMKALLTPRFAHTHKDFIPASKIELVHNGYYPFSIELRSFNSSHCTKASTNWKSLSEGNSFSS